MNNRVLLSANPVIEEVIRKFPDLKTAFRFLSKVRIPIDVETGCWEWTARRDEEGYGKFEWKNKNCSASRLILSFFSGIPFTVLLCTRHICDNPPCVNPFHLLSGTKADNFQDMYSRGRYRTAPQGEDHANAKLTEQDIYEIFDLRLRGIGFDEIAKLKNVTEGLIGHVLTRRAWGHVPIPKRVVEQVKTINNSVKLSSEDFATIFALYYEQKLSQRKIAEMYGLAYKYLNDIFKGRARAADTSLLRAKHISVADG